MSDIFDEVEEAQKADRLNAFWNKSWPIFLGGAFAIIAVVGGNSYLESQKQKRIENAGKAFEIAEKSVENQDIARTRSEYAKALASNTGFAELSGHYLAQAEMQLAGDEAAATVALEKSAEGKGPIADLARMKVAYFKADKLSLAELESEIASLLAREDAYGALAQELIAAKAFEEGDYKRAQSEYQALTLKLNTPEGVSRRANDALSILSTYLEDTEEVEQQDAEASNQDTASDAAEEDPS